MLTQISDVVIPEVFADYLKQQSLQTNRLIQSGLVTVDGSLSAAMNEGGLLYHIPSWSPVDQGAFETVTDDTTLAVVNNVLSGTEIAIKQMHAKVWGAANLATALAGDNPLGQVAAQVGSAVNHNKTLHTVKTLEGLFGLGGVLEGRVIDGSAGVLDKDMLIDATAVFEDNYYDDVSLILIVHSKVYNSLQKQNLIDFRPTNEQNVVFPTYLGLYRLVIDNNISVDDTDPQNPIYTSYVGRAGALRLGQGTMETVLHTEPMQGKGAGSEYFIQRDNFMVHPTGCAFTGTGSGSGGLAMAADLANVANWAKVYVDKQIPLTAIKSLGE